MSDLVYEASDYTAGLPVGIRELDVLIEQKGRPISRDGRKMVHFLTRVRDTVDSHTQDVAGMRHRIEELTVDRARVGTPTTLRPADALKFAAPEEIEAVVDRISRQQLARLRALIDEAEKERENLVDQFNHIRRVIADAADNQEIPSELAAQLLSQIGDAPEPITRPAALSWETPDNLNYDPEPTPPRHAPEPEPQAPPRRRNQQPAQTEQHHSPGSSDGGQEDGELDELVSPLDPEDSGLTSNPFSADPVRALDAPVEAPAVPDAPVPAFSIPTPEFPVAAPFSETTGSTGWADEMSAELSTPQVPATSTANPRELDLENLFDDEAQTSPTSELSLENLFDDDEPAR